ncbi:MAG TPA: hypothetical protein DIC18_03890 [Clostridiales bacterium]|nr:hypothetical protein [Clostridiales bacterium]HCU56455.1 hypothetical protein [Clostridiales bacterium]
MKKKIDFYKLLEQQGLYVVKAMTLLSDYCKSGEKDQADEVIALEEQADDIRRTLIENLNRTYITPIDREDLFHLSRLLDEIIDYIKTSVDEVKLFRITPNEDLLQITETLLEMAGYLYDAMRFMSTDQEASKGAAYKVKHLENVMEGLTKGAYANIFESDDFKMIFKYNEIYRHLNHTADVADSAMDFLLDIFVKM